ncbi:hypothetical protein GOBAR_AA11298 [Gossypium barbadense]|uniref:Uncharacterized protein n=1 Tax=Gossypium barbadense TaxID=3634 RepID=A0A2P5Y155_GOSBA|nr:hypothetical protein GOBAR_AA11298 [Gossypium barbadense]
MEIRPLEKCKAMSNPYRDLHHRTSEYSISLTGVGEKPPKAAALYNIVGIKSPLNLVLAVPNCNCVSFLTLWSHERGTFILQVLFIVPSFGVYAFIIGHAHMIEIVVTYSN